MRNSTNEELAHYTLAALESYDVPTLCICPGARNSPWLNELEKSSRFGSFERLYFFDERSAGFFALARARKGGKPVAVLTTSGTAVGELLPAMMEAHHSGSSLWVLSADRPRRFRGTGAPQSCEQRGIFGVYANWTVELDRTASLDGKLTLPENTFTSHWNICFEEPLPSDEKNRTSGVSDLIPSSEENNLALLNTSKYPLAIVGELRAEEKAPLLQFLKSSQIPVITETLSGLRDERELDSLRIYPSRKLWEESRDCDYPIDLVLRFGAMPTLRFWRDLEVHPEASQVPVISVGRLNFRGLVRAQHDHGDIQPWIQARSRYMNQSSVEKLRCYQTRKMLTLEDAIQKFPLSEAGWFRFLSEVIPDNSEIYLGNSLPIREWDLAAIYKMKDFRFNANRGLNGIDGQLSSFFGTLRGDRENWCILGDLTTLYDSSAPWILSQLDPKIRWHLVVVNNSGGRIFERMFSSTSYQNRHQLSFENWAKQWGLSYQRLTERKDLSAQVIEIVPNEEASRFFWNAWEPT